MTNLIYYPRCKEVKKSTSIQHKTRIASSVNKYVSGRYELMVESSFTKSDLLNQYDDCDMDM